MDYSLHFNLFFSLISLAILHIDRWTNSVVTVWKKNGHIQSKMNICPCVWKRSVRRTAENPISNSKIKNCHYCKIILSSIFIVSVLIATFRTLHFSALWILSRLKVWYTTRIYMLTQANKNTSGLCCSGTNGFISFWLQFFDKRRETQFLLC